MLLLIDNYDSFTYNLLHYFQDLGEEVHVVRNDAITLPELSSLNPRAVILSPGPCDPDKAGICLPLITELAETYPIFGVCLGHQAIGQAFGGKVIRAPHPMHGKVSKIFHNEHSPMFKGITSPFSAARYHSLIVEKETLPDILEITAETEDGVIMGLKHKHLPIYGVQFHPESIASEYGHQLLRNFLDAAA